MTLTNHLLNILQTQSIVLVIYVCYLCWTGGSCAAARRCHSVHLFRDGTLNGPSLWPSHGASPSLVGGSDQFLTRMFASEGKFCGSTKVPPCLAKYLKRLQPTLPKMPSPRAEEMIILILVRKCLSTTPWQIQLLYVRSATSMDCGPIATVFRPPRTTAPVRQHVFQCIPFNIATLNSQKILVVGRREVTLQGTSMVTRKLNSGRATYGRFAED